MINRSFQVIPCIWLTLVFCDSLTSYMLWAKFGNAFRERTLFVAPLFDMFGSGIFIVGAIIAIPIAFMVWKSKNKPLLALLSALIAIEIYAVLNNSALLIAPLRFM